MISQFSLNLLRLVSYEDFYKAKFCNVLFFRVLFHILDCALGIGRLSFVD
jgi:hypothetical protein